MSHVIILTLLSAKLPQRHHRPTGSIGSLVAHKHAPPQLRVPESGITTAFQTRTSPFNRRFQPPTSANSIHRIRARRRLATLPIIALHLSSHRLSATNCNHVGIEAEGSTARQAGPNCSAVWRPQCEILCVESRSPRGPSHGGGVAGARVLRHRRRRARFRLRLQDLSPRRERRALDHPQVGPEAGGLRQRVGEEERADVGGARAGCQRQASLLQRRAEQALRVDLSRGLHTRLTFQRPRWALPENRQGCCTLPEAV